MSIFRPGERASELESKVEDRLLSGLQMVYAEDSRLSATEPPRTRSDPGA